MNNKYYLIIIALAATIHACFQLCVSVLTLLSAHTLGVKKSQNKLFRLATSFLIGSFTMTVLILSDVVLVAFSIYQSNIPQLAWCVGCGILLVSGAAVWLFYFRKGPGTMLWIPRGMAHYLNNRASATKSCAESFGLGLVSVFGEIMFIIAPIIIAALAITQLPLVWQPMAIGGYAIISTMSLAIVWLLIIKGYKLSRIQRWREENKRFMQFSAGAGLIILSIFVFVNVILNYSIGGM